MKRRGALLLLGVTVTLAHAHGAHEHGSPQTTSLSAPLPASSSVRVHQHAGPDSDGGMNAAHAGGHDHSVAAKTQWDPASYPVPFSYAILDASDEGGRPGALWTHIGSETIAWFVALPLGECSLVFKPLTAQVSLCAPLTIPFMAPHNSHSSFRTRPACSPAGFTRSAPTTSTRAARTRSSAG